MGILAWYLPRDTQSWLGPEIQVRDTLIEGRKAQESEAPSSSVLPQLAVVDMRLLICFSSWNNWNEVHKVLQRNQQLKLRQEEKRVSERLCIKTGAWIHNLKPPHEYNSRPGMMFITFINLKEETVLVSHIFCFKKSEETVIPWNTIWTNISARRQIHSNKLYEHWYKKMNKNIISPKSTIY